MPLWLEILMVAVFGLCVGSFLNVCAYRLPLGESIVSPASRCTKCGRTLSWFDNVPVISWVVLRGRCRTCDAPVSWMYPAVEIITALVFVLTYLTYGWTLLSLVRLAFACALIVLFITDLQHKILPNSITLPGIPRRSSSLATATTSARSTRATGPRSSSCVRMADRRPRRARP